MKLFKDLLKGGSSMHVIQMLVDTGFPLVVWFSIHLLWLLQTKELDTFILILICDPNFWFWWNDLKVLPVGGVRTVPSSRNVSHSKDHLEALWRWAHEDVGGRPHQPTDVDQQGGENGEGSFHQKVLQRINQESWRICHKFFPLWNSGLCQCYWTNLLHWQVSISFSHSTKKS